MIKIDDIPLTVGFAEIFVTLDAYIRLSLVTAESEANIIPLIWEEYQRFLMVNSAMQGLLRTTLKPLITEVKSCRFRRSTIFDREEDSTYGYIEFVHLSNVKMR